MGILRIVLPGSKSTNTSKFAGESDHEYRYENFPMILKFYVMIGKIAYSLYANGLFELERSVLFDGVDSSKYSE